MDSTCYNPPADETSEDPSASGGVNDFELKFTGKVTETHIIPALVLAQTLEALQKSVYILAMDQENRVVRERVRVPSDIEQKYVVRCEVPDKGSYQVPFAVGNSQADLFPATIDQVSERLRNGFKAFTDANFNELHTIIPDRALQSRLLEQFRSLIPRPGTGITLDINDAQGNAFTFSPSLLLPLRQYLAGNNKNEESIQTVTGQLERIDFGEHKITIIYPSTSRQLDCFYDESAEGMLLDNPRELIQVTGRVIFDETGQPIKITDVESILEVDLSPFYLSQVEWQGRVISLRSPITLVPELDDSSQLLQVRYKPFDLHVFAQTRDQVWVEINEFIAMLWEEYASEEDVNLSQPAIDLKNVLLSALEVSE